MGNLWPSFPSKSCRQPHLHLVCRSSSVASAKDIIGVILCVGGVCVCERPNVGVKSHKA